MPCFLAGEYEALLDPPIARLSVAGSSFVRPYTNILGYLQKFRYVEVRKMTPMNSLNQGGSQPEYMGIVKGLWPLFLVGFGIALVSGAAHVKRSYLQRNKLQLVLNIIMSSAVSSAVALGFSLLAPLVYPEITPEMQIGIVLVVNGIGLKLFDAYMRKKYGLHVVDLMDPSDINFIRVQMTQEQRQEHVKNCPFKGDDCCTSCQKTDGLCDKPSGM